MSKSHKPGTRSKRGLRAIFSTRPSTPRAKGRGYADAEAMSGARIAILALLACAFLLTLASLFVGGALWYFGRDLPSGDALRNYQPPQTTRIVDRRGVTIGEMFSERRTVVPMKRIPRVLVLSVLAA